MATGFYRDIERGVLRAGLMQIASDATKLGGKSFAALSAEQQVTLLMKQYDQAQYEQGRANPSGTPHFFRIKELTIIGYCTSEPGATKLLKYEQTPGPYRGDIPYSQVGKAWAL